MNFSFNKTANVYISKKEFEEFLCFTYEHNNGEITLENFMKEIEKEANKQIDCPIYVVYVDAPGIFKKVSDFTNSEIEELLKPYSHYFKIGKPNYKKF